MADERIKVGFVGCGGISNMYADIYADLADMAQVVADLVDDLAEKRRRVLTDAYAAEAHAARARAMVTRDDEVRAKETARSEAAARTKIRKYPSHEEFLKDDEVQAIALLTAPGSNPPMLPPNLGAMIFTQGPMTRSVADTITAAVRDAGVKAQSLVPIEVPRHHVEVVRAIYKSAEEQRPVTLPLDKANPFYSFAGRLSHGAKRPAR